MTYRSSPHLDASEPELKRAVFDRDHLGQYTMGCPELERELIALFLDQLPDLTRQLEGSFEDEDWKYVTHTLKGSARAIGAMMIADLAECLEEQGPHAAESVRFGTIIKLKAAISAFRIEVAQIRG